MNIYNEHVIFLNNIILGANKIPLFRYLAYQVMPGIALLAEEFVEFSFLVGKL